MSLSDLISEIFNDTKRPRSLCDSWATCLRHSVVNSHCPWLRFWLCRNRLASGMFLPVRQTVPLLPNFTYLGSILSNDVVVDNKIADRISKASSNFGRFLIGW